jgi:hypothetical protein
MFLETLYNPELGAVWWFFVLLVYCVGAGYAGSGPTDQWINIRISEECYLLD